MPKRNTKTRLYSDSYLELGFTWSGDELCPNPKCLVCGEELSNEAMLPSKLTRHFSTKHKHLSGKSVDYFKRLLDSLQKQRTTFVKKFKISDRAQKASYLVAEIIAKDMKPHTIAETLIRPACAAIVRTMLGTEAEEEIKKVPLSDDTISRRIVDMSDNIAKKVSLKIKEAGMYALQVDETTDIGGKAQLLVYSRFIEDEKIIEQFLCCKELPKHTTGSDMFNVLNEYLESINLPWVSCVGICTDGAPSMTGCLKGFVTRAKKQNPNIISTHCFIHREALVAKTVGKELEHVLNRTVAMVNYIKSKPLKSRLFAALCEEMGSEHVNLLLHTEVRWLSKGRVLSRFWELRKEVQTFFESENIEQFFDLLQDHVWCAKLAYLTNIFEYLNKIC